MLQTLVCISKKFNKSLQICCRHLYALVRSSTNPYKYVVATCMHQYEVQQIFANMLQTLVGISKKFNKPLQICCRHLYVLVRSSTNPYKYVVDTCMHQYEVQQILINMLQTLVCFSKKFNKSLQICCRHLYALVRSSTNPYKYVVDTCMHQ